MKGNLKSVLKQGAQYLIRAFIGEEFVAIKVGAMGTQLKLIDRASVLI